MLRPIGREMSSTQTWGIDSCDRLVSCHLLAMCLRLDFSRRYGAKRSGSRHDGIIKAFLRYEGPLVPLLQT